MRILSVFGTRPEAVKMSPVVQALAKTPGFESFVCVTAQHREMLDQVLDLFDITPNVDLDLMRPDQSLAGLSAAIFTNLDPVLESIKPDWVLVQGDTTTVAITSLLSYYHRIRVGHVEAGLRTFDKWQPFPEEINRRVAGITADLHFAPTEWTKRNLLHEGIPEAAIRVTGNPVIDALIVVSKQSEPKVVKGLVDQLGLKHGKRLVLVTAHRRENFGAPLENIFTALKNLAARGDLEIVYPVHLNPNVQEPARRMLQNIPHITLLPPLDYLPMVHLMKRAVIVLTDSGGIQEEAPAFGIPTLVLREVTERPEGVEAGTLKLVGTDTEKIMAEATSLLDDPAAYNAMAKATNPFGDGHAAKRIVQALLDFPSY
ncbi:MAG TPA: UDP-N-acetylglucosamine 2-epimerase (non-hydrolyzing) [Anaerolineae bacterium]|nr:UDP-N-acetylglucosamine 2-epimerase (non-hydrolyzing) [Anaerolineae bacterium]HCC78907.1 UDP-N-acetylglucosamine 2-epimerase (non-hydrolyzing) [Anaerolineae bacterium]HCM97590.1 UDP-N-acetylglucosamine 2-epimerase (non-hydrolyzing) [Anaerolineae bacterium]